MSYADKVFKETCKDILENGTDTMGEVVRPKWEDGTPSHTIKKFGVVNTYDLRKEFPAITLRRIALKSAMDEILWIYQKKSNLTETLNSRIWDSWAHLESNQELVYVQPIEVESFEKTYNDKISCHPILNHNIEEEKNSKRFGKYFKIENLEGKKVKIQFINTGNIIIVSRNSYYNGAIMDYYARSVYDVGYYGNYKRSDLVDYFGEFFDRWVDIWRHVIRRCTKNFKTGHYLDCTVSPLFQSCENFLEWVMKNNPYGKKYLSELQIDKDYKGSRHYSEQTCTLLLPIDNTRLTLKKWFKMNNKYFFSRNEFALYLRDKLHKNFIIATDSKGLPTSVSKDIDKFIAEGVNLKTIEIINPHEKTELGYPRFSLNKNHSIGTCYGWTIGHEFPYKGQMIDQMDYVLKQLKENPFSRRIMTNMYQYDYLSGGGLDPCAYSMTYNVTKEDGKLVLNAILNQRSQDMLAANGWNTAQYAILLMMVAQVVGMIPGKLIHVIADCHIYDRHVPMIKELLDREEYPAPKVSLNPFVKDFYDFTTKDLIVENYEFGEQITDIPIAV